MMRFLIWLDRQVNDKWFGGYFETISGRCYYTNCWFCTWLCKALHKIDGNHCEDAYKMDRQHNQSLPKHDKLL